MKNNRYIIPPLKSFGRKSLQSYQRLQMNVFLSVLNSVYLDFFQKTALYCTLSHIASPWSQTEFHYHGNQFIGQVSKVGLKGYCNLLPWITWLQIWGLFMEFLEGDYLTVALLPLCAYTLRACLQLFLSFWIFFFFSWWSTAKPTKSCHCFFSNLEHCVL